MALSGLLSVEAMEVVSLMDNFLDVTMAGNDHARRVAMSRDFLARPQPRAEHGSSMLIAVPMDGRRQSLLLDTGSTRDGVLHNLVALGVEPEGLRAVVISHGHFDHTSGLLPILDRFGHHIAVHLHPDAFLKRKVVYRNGSELEMPALDALALAGHGVKVVATREPSLLLDGHALLTGEVARTTSFEQGLPGQFAEIDGRWQPDPLTYDDQAVVIHVRQKGLVVITGCGHAGIMNTLRYARTLTGIDELYAVIGGLHLGRPTSKQVVPETVAELERLAPRIIVPTHCTGWQAAHAIATALPSAFIANSVGTRYLL